MADTSAALSEKSSGPAKPASGSFGRWILLTQITPRFCAMTLMHRRMPASFWVRRHGPRNPPRHPRIRLASRIVSPRSTQICAWH